MNRPKRIHKTTLRVPFSDVDMVGIVYTPKFVDYILKGWEDYFRALGIPWESYLGTDRIKGLPVISLNLKFKSPARYGDEIEIITRISKLTRKRIYFRFELLHKEEKRLIAAGSLVVTAFDQNNRPTHIPDFIIGAI